MIRVAASSNANLTTSEIKRKRRRSAIEPVIDHEIDHRLDRCYLKRRADDAVNLVGGSSWRGKLLFDLCGQHWVFSGKWASLDPLRFLMRLV